MTVGSLAHGRKINNVSLCCAVLSLYIAKWTTWLTTLFTSPHCSESHLRSGEKDQVAMESVGTYPRSHCCSESQHGVVRKEKMAR